MTAESTEMERILVCVSASPTSADVIRRAARLSRTLGAELIALYVEDPETQSDAQEKTVHEHLALAEQQGAILTTIYGNDPATAIAPMCISTAPSPSTHQTFVPGLLNATPRAIEEL